MIQRKIFANILYSQSYFDMFRRAVFFRTRCIMSVWLLLQNYDTVFWAFEEILCVEVFAWQLHCLPTSHCSWARDLCTFHACKPLMNPQQGGVSISLTTPSSMDLPGCDRTSCQNSTLIGWTAWAWTYGVVKRLCVLGVFSRPFSRS